MAPLQLAYYYELFLGALVGLFVGSLVVYVALRSHFVGQVFGQAQRMASQMFEQQKSQLEGSFRSEYEAKMGEWKAMEMARAIEEERADAVDTSRAVLRGKIAEQFALLLPGFLSKYNPADARFIGSPINYLIFRRMSKGDDSEDPVEIVLLDVKTGKAGLKGVQKRFEEAVRLKRVSFDILRFDENVRPNTESEEIGSQQLKLSVIPLDGPPHPSSD